MAALAGWVTNDLSNSTKFSNAAEFNAALRSITELGIQNIRYQPLFATTDASQNKIGACWTPSTGSEASEPFNGFNVAVWCTTKEDLTKSKGIPGTREVTLYACPATITTGLGCQTTPSLTATVSFDDYPSNGGSTLSVTCSYPNCGFSATPVSWTWGSNPGGVPTPSTTLPVVVGPAAKLAFITVPIGASEGTNFQTNPQVAVEDANGNVITGDSSNVTISITNYVAGSSGGSTMGALSGCTKSGELNGVISFSNCSISGPAAAGTYVLSAKFAGLTTATAPVAINAGTATQLAFSTQPVAGVPEGTSFATNPQVAVEDANGNIVITDNSTVTLAITGATSQVLNGCVQSSETQGIITFSACNVTGNAAAGAYSLTATEIGLSSAQSNSFTVSVGAASQLMFTTPPPASIIAIKGSMSFNVTVTDANGNPVTSSHQTDSIKVAATGMTTTTVTAVAGTAHFSGLAMSTPGQFTITATDGTFTGTATVTVFGFVTKGSATNTSTTTQSVSGVGTTTSDALLILIAYNSVSNSTPACASPTGSAISGTPVRLAAASQWSGIGSPYYGYCAYTADVATTGGTVSETMTGVAGGSSTDYMQMQVIEVTGDTSATFPVGGITAFGSPTTQTTNTSYFAGTINPGDSEVILAAGTSGSTTAPTFTEPTNFNQLVDAGGWGLISAKYDVNIAAGPAIASTTGKINQNSTYGSYGIDLTP